MSLFWLVETTVWLLAATIWSAEITWSSTTDYISCTSSLAFPFDAAASAFVAWIRLSLVFFEAPYLLSDRVAILSRMSCSLSSGTSAFLEVRAILSLSVTLRCNWFSRRIDRLLAKGTLTIALSSGTYLQMFLLWRINNERASMSWVTNSDLALGLPSGLRLVRWFLWVTLWVILRVVLWAVLWVIREWIREWSCEWSFEWSYECTVECPYTGSLRGSYILLLLSSFEPSHPETISILLSSSRRSSSWSDPLNQRLHCLRQSVPGGASVCGLRARLTCDIRMECMGRISNDMFHWRCVAREVCWHVWNIRMVCMDHAPVRRLTSERCMIRKAYIWLHTSLVGGSEYAAPMSSP